MHYNVHTSTFAQFLRVRASIASVLARVILSVCPGVTTQYRSKTRWDRDFRFTPYDNLEFLVFRAKISCCWVKGVTTNEGEKERQTTASYIRTGLLSTVDSPCDITGLVQCWQILFVYTCMSCEMFDNFYALCLPLSSLSYQLVSINTLYCVLLTDNLTLSFSGWNAITGSSIV